MINSHIHTWKTARESVYLKRYPGPTETPILPAIRICTKCGLMMWQDVHCLGLNPPTYMKSWFILPKHSIPRLKALEERINEQCIATNENHQKPEVTEL